MNRKTFEAQLAPLREPLSRFVAMMVGREAEDIVQEAAAVAFRDLGRFEGRSKFSTWIYGIALNLCRKHLRDKTRRAAAASPELLADQPARRHGVLSSVIRHEMAERLEISVGRLPTPMREAFVLRYVDQMDYPEIAEITGVSEGTARVRAFRARALLREELGDVVDTVWLEKDPEA
jgi:RNA polymerase sigma-70 factor (ECF subfamily)